MHVFSDPKELTDCQGGVFVPTMGALHDGHLALIRHAANLNQGPVIVSIFVNPTQFAPDEDFAQYPRDLDSDLEKVKHAGSQFVFTPSVETIYPLGEQSPAPPLPGVATNPGLEDAYRPGHLQGVCQVVARFFDLVNPAKAIFGEKDYQQLLVIKAMVKQEGDRWGDLEIIGHETIRESDSLALSSRNAYLSDEDRNRALGISKAFHGISTQLSVDECEQSMRRILEDHHFETEYAVVRDAQTLNIVTTFDKPTRALIAARLGSTRLIDNLAIPARLT
ncbi:MAG: pantoate--beta-alanine ligase [Planctomycetota bacterium]|nr:pantoate--beta-alanine ligase [Planctomycetota bacterium]